MMMMPAESYELEQHRAYNSAPHYAPFSSPLGGARDLTAARAKGDGRVVSVAKLSLEGLVRGTGLDRFMRSRLDYEIIHRTIVHILFIREFIL